MITLLLFKRSERFILIQQRQTINTLSIFIPFSTWLPAVLKKTLTTSVHGFIFQIWLSFRFLRCVLLLSCPDSVLSQMNNFSYKLQPGGESVAVFVHNLKGSRWHICVRKQLWSLNTIQKHNSKAEGNIYINGNIKGNVVPTLQHVSTKRRRNKSKIQR